MTKRNDRKVREFRNRIGLDNYWVYERSKLACPFCFQKGLWLDTHDNFQASHYCSRCVKFFTILDAEQREVIEDEL